MANLTYLLPAVNPLLGYSSGKPVQAHLAFFSTASDPRTLITPENGRRNNTNYPSPPNVTFLGDLDVPFGPQGPQPAAPPEPHVPPGTPGPPGIPPGWPQAPPPAGGKRIETGNALRERLHPRPRPSPPEPQLMPVPMSDCEDDDDQPPQGERQRQRSRSRERVYPYLQVPQVPQIQPVFTPESDDEISDDDVTIVKPSPSSAE